MPPRKRDVRPYVEKYGDTIRELRAQGLGDSGIAARLDGKLTRHMVRCIIEDIEGDDLADPTTEEHDLDGEDWHFDQLGDDARVWSRKGSEIHTVDDLLEQAEVDLEAWQPYAGNVRSWEGFAKVKKPQAEGGGESVVKQTLHAVSVKLERRYDVGLQAPEPLRTFTMPIPPDPAEEQTTVYIPDSQIGFRWDETKTHLDPMHDRRALDSIVQFIALTQPDNVVLCGDMLDLASLSTRFPRPPELRGCDKPAIWELHWWIAQLRLVAPKARILYCEGNHEARYRKFIVEKASDLQGIMHPVGEETPANPLAWLLRLDALGVEYIGPYGAETYLAGPVRITHGSTAKSKPGHTVSGLIEKAHHSVVVGHIHRREIVHRRVREPDGSWRTIFAMSAGCTCRVDGAVPAARFGPMDWQQGVGVSRYYPEAGAVVGNVLAIEDGVLYADGGPIIGRHRKEEIAEFTGYPQIVGMS